MSMKAIGDFIKKSISGSHTAINSLDRGDPAGFLKSGMFSGVSNSIGNMIGETGAVGKTFHYSNLEKSMGQKGADKIFGVKRDKTGKVLNEEIKDINTFEKEMSTFDVVKMAHMNKDGGYSAAKIAGTAFTGAVGYRFASGGGIYRDKNGNTDIAGIPFI